MDSTTTITYIPVEFDVEDEVEQINGLIHRLNNGHDLTIVTSAAGNHFMPDSNKYFLKHQHN